MTKKGEKCRKINRNTVLIYGIIIPIILTTREREYETHTREAA